MGVGGGGLLVIYLTLFESTEQLVAQGTNLCFFILFGLASTIYNVIKKKIVWKTTLILSLSGAISSVLGSILTSQINPYLLRTVFGGMLVLSGGASLVSSFVKNKQNGNI